MDGKLGHVTFKAMGGSTNISATGDDTPSYAGELRNGVRVGACPCDELDDGEWIGTCFDSDICNGSGERNIATDHLAWNPINSKHANDYETGPVDYVERQEIEDHWVFHQKEMLMTKDPAQNTHFLSWSWTYAERYDDWGENLQSWFDAKHEDHPGRKTKIRAAWPFYYRDPFYQGNDREVVYSNAVEMKLGNEYTIPHGDLYLGPEWIVDVIPGAVDGRWDPRGPLHPGYLLGADEDNGLVHLYGLDKRTPVVSRIWELSGQGLDPSASFTSTAGLVPGTFMGSSNEMERALFLYQIVDETSSGGASGEEAQARLFVGAESDGAIIDLVTSESLIDASTPLVNNPQLVYVRGLQHLLLLGTPVGSAIPTTWKLDLVSGAWQGPGDTKKSSLCGPRHFGCGCL